MLCIDKDYFHNLSVGMLQKISHALKLQEPNNCYSPCNSHPAHTFHTTHLTLSYPFIFQFDYVIVSDGRVKLFEFSKVPVVKKWCEKLAPMCFRTGVSIIPVCNATDCSTRALIDRWLYYEFIHRIRFSRPSGHCAAFLLWPLRPFCYAARAEGIGILGKLCNSTSTEEIISSF